MRRSLLTLSILSLLSTTTLRAQDFNDAFFAGGFYVNAASARFNKPIFRAPQETKQVPVDQTVGGTSFAVGYETIWNRVGFGLALSFWRTSVPSFAFDPFEDTGSPSPTLVHVNDARFGLILFDMIVHVLPMENGPVDVYGHLGLGNRSSVYTVTQADEPFKEWEGPQSIDEFEFSYGIGLRVKPIRFLSFFAEYRLAPGDLDESSGSGSYVVVYYSNGTSSGSPSGSFSQYTKIFSLGAQITFEL